MVVTYKVPHAARVRRICACRRKTWTTSRPLAWSSKCGCSINFKCNWKCILYSKNWSLSAASSQRAETTNAYEGVFFFFFFHLWYKYDLIMFLLERVWVSGLTPRTPSCFFKHTSELSSWCLPQKWQKLGICCNIFK